MKVCLMIEGQEGVTWEDWVRIARLTEENGFDGLFRSDHYTAIKGDVLDRIRMFEQSRGSDADPAQMLEERKGRWISGTVEQVAERIEGLRRIGVTRVFLQHLNHGDDDMVRLLGAELIPAVAA